jgi:DNA-binding NarL/FixJ family response regulator
MLHSAPAIHVVGVAAAIAAARAHVEFSYPDVVVIDVDRNPERLELVIATLLEDFSGVTVVLLAAGPGSEWVARMLRSGVASILRRDSSPGQITAAVRAAAETLIVLEPDAAGGLLEPTDSEEDVPEGHQSEREEPPLVEELTRREVEVLRMVAAGLGNREIGLRLGVSEHTIKFHISSILGKLGASSRTEAVTQGIKRGLILL